jgi:uridylate kinase
MSTEKERVILKLSGELFGKNGDNIDFQKYNSVSLRLIKIWDDSRAQIAIVVGGGNIFRGREANSQVDSTEADSMGMLATVMNGIGLREALVRNGAVETRLMTAFPIPGMAEPYIKHRARHHLDKDRIIIISGGLGMPGFSTDSAVAQYAQELRCRMVLKASTVDGVYDSDPRQNPSAQKYSRVSFDEVITNKIQVMDPTAFTMCQRSNIPIFVFNISDLDKTPEAIAGDYSFGTIIRRC